MLPAHAFLFPHVILRRCGCGVFGATRISSSSGPDRQFPKLDRGSPVTAAGVLGASAIQMGILSGVSGASVLRSVFSPAPGQTACTAVQFSSPPILAEPRTERGAAPHFGREIVEGLHALWREPVLRTLAPRLPCSWVSGVACTFSSPHKSSLERRAIEVRPALLVFAIGSLHVAAGIFANTPLAEILQMFPST
jgi:hypothetical protein